MTASDYLALRHSLRVLRDALPRLRAGLAGEGVVPETPAWHQRLAQNVLPALDFDLPVLLVAICGGGSTGKSTLLNSLAGRRLSQVGFRAGLTTRVLLVGHPKVLSGAQVAEALLYRLQARPEPWRSPEQTVSPGPPLYATSDSLPPSLLLIDTPDFDTGEGGELINRQRASAVLRTADVLIYTFTNTVYNNLGNTQFMADVVGGIGGRPTVLVYRISRAASDAEVLEHCRTVAQRLYASQRARGDLPPEVIGLYRVHESDQVAEGHAAPRLIPIGPTRRELPELLRELDVGAIKRHVFAADLQSIREGAATLLADMRREAAAVALYRDALRATLAQQALEALKKFPANEAIALTVRLFIETSPGYVRALRTAGDVVSAPFRAVLFVGRKLGQWTGLLEAPAPTPDVRQAVDQDLLLAANNLRNRLLDDHLILQVGRNDALLQGAQAAGVPVEPLGGRTYNVHIPVPAAVQRQERALLDQDWAHVTAVLHAAAEGLLGLPAGIEDELRRQVAEFRQHMNWRQRLRETFFASLSALPPLLGVTYMLLTADPVSGGGIWIQLQSLFGLNDLWALVSIPATLGLSEQDRRQLEELVAPAFRLWLERRVQTIVGLFEQTVCRPALTALAGAPAPDDPQWTEVERALAALEESA